MDQNTLAQRLDRLESIKAIRQLAGMYSPDPEGNVDYPAADACSLKELP